MERYNCNDIEIISAPTKLSLESKKELESVDMIPYHDEDGKAHYMDEASFIGKIKSDYQNVEHMFKAAKNSLNKLKNVNFSPEILYLEATSANGITTDYLDESIAYNYGVIVDYDYCNAKRCEKAQKRKMKKIEKNNKHRKKKMPLKALRKAACLATVIFGLSFISSSSVGGDINNKDAVSTTYKNDATNIDNTSKSQKETGIGNSYIKDDKKQIKYSKYIQLKDTKLNYTSTGAGPSGSTKVLNCDSYRPTRVAILNDDNTIIDTFDMPKNKHINIKKMKNKIKSVYGSSVNIQINVDGVKDGKIVHKQAGWTSINKAKSIKVKDKTYEKHI